MHDHTKHVKIDKHFIREMIVSKELTLSYMKDQDQFVDIFIKGFFFNDFERNVCLGIFDMYAQFKEEY